MNAPHTAVKSAPRAPSLALLIPCRQEHSPHSPKPSERALISADRHDESDQYPQRQSWLVHLIGHMTKARGRHRERWKTSSEPATVQVPFSWSVSVTQRPYAAHASDVTLWSQALHVSPEVRGVTQDAGCISWGWAVKHDQHTAPRPTHSSSLTLQGLNTHKTLTFYWLWCCTH